MHSLGEDQLQFDPICRSVSHPHFANVYEKK